MKSSTYSSNAKDLGSHIDVIKLQSSMVLFNKVAPGEVFQQVLEAYY
ncbi:MAG: DUF1810 family protein [Prevotellamassilia sp.]|nr:DUF1810 family protein [Prevotellamassilia sp.]